MPPTPQPQVRPVSTTADALCDEFRALHDEEIDVGTDRAPNALEDGYRRAAAGKAQAALCLSGGGIRSASFCLGVIQALARKGLLSQFHYLSTVSGGGYIGGWLSAFIYARGGDVVEVERTLAAAEAPEQVHNLRQYTNFLTPKPGITSPDTWTGVILWIRNVLINWMLFLPALLAIAIVPQTYADLIEVVGPGWGWPLLLIGLLCLGLGVFVAAQRLPSHAPPDAMMQGSDEAGIVQRRVILPVLVWSFLVALVAAPSLRLIMPVGAVPPLLIPFGSFLVMVGAYVAVMLRQGADHRTVFRNNLFWWTFACLVAAVILGVGLDIGLDRGAVLLAVLAPAWVTIAHLMQSLIYVALRRDAMRGDLDREWLARLSAEKVVPTLLWAIFASVCLLTPPLVLDGWSTRFWPWVLSVAGVLTGPVAAFLGKSAIASVGIGNQDGASKLTVPVDIVLGIATTIFAAALFMLLARLGWLITGELAPVHGDVMPWYRPLVDAAVLSFAGLVSWVLGFRININRFSMHAVYRNRLVRSFLGSARTAAVRQPDGYTGDDARDNPRMGELFTRINGTRTLFHVVNVTLNLAAGRRRDWAERKAESFTITPLACGATYLRRTEDTQAGKPARGAYARTGKYAGSEHETGPEDKAEGITLGTAVTVSGAAVSPSMGYHSSPATAFLMTLFNVRLGAWLPNPAIATTEQLREAKPPNALFTLAREMLGLTDDRGPDVYLSDGGHFDNLGLYEMVRRRCRYIVLVDAGGDAKATFTDVGNAVRKVYIDQDIRIEFDMPVGIGSRDKPVPQPRNFARGRIHYPEDNEPGKLIYIKPSYLPDVPIDVSAYGAASPTFPHESTLEQWFTESQFESYRRLGDDEMTRLGGPQTPLPPTIAGFFAAVEVRLQPAAAAATVPPAV